MVFSSLSLSTLLMCAVLFSPPSRYSTIKFTQAASTVNVDMETLTTNEEDKSRIVEATVLIDDEGLFDMPSFTFTGMGNNSDMAVYVKTTSSARTLESGKVETVWEGAIDDPDRMGFATLMEDIDGGIAGTFTTDVAVYGLDLMPDGKLLVRARFWGDMKEEEDHSEEDSTSENETPIVGTANETVTVSEDSILKGIEGNMTFSFGDGPVMLNSDGRRLSNEARTAANGYVDIKVLVLVTHRAVCQAANMRNGCEYSRRNRAPILRRIPILARQTQSSFNLKLNIHIAGTAFLDPSYSSTANGATLRYIRNNPTIVAWRKQVKADLVIMITGTGCGLASLGRNEAYVSYSCLDQYSFTHELGHNLGARHNRENSTRFHEFSHGYRQSSRTFRSVMAYNCGGRGCMRLPYFSCGGCNIMGNRNGDSRHDNRRLISQNARAVSRWSTSYKPLQLVSSDRPDVDDSQEGSEAKGTSDGSFLLGASFIFSFVSSALTTAVFLMF